MPKHAPLPADLIEFLRQRQKQLAPLCPRCGRRPQEVPETGWCYPCTDERTNRELARKRVWWNRHRGKDADLFDDLVEECEEA